MPLDNRLENIIGAPLPDWVILQLNQRSEQNSKEYRDNANLTYLSNKNAFIRVISSVDVIGGQQQEYFKNLGISVSDKQSLAQQFILYGGTSKYFKDNNGVNYELRGGFKDTYNILNENEVNKYGYRPMPGISSAKITTQGRLGSIRGATIDFKVWDKAQLDIIDTLYFRLGYSIFIEWGHINYCDNNGKLHSGEENIIDPFALNLDKDDLRYQISKKVRESQGNYDAMLGIITNFSFTLNQEGGYDCTINTISLGVLGESMRVNNTSVLANVLSEEVKQIVNVLNKFAEAKKDKENQGGGDQTPPKGDPKEDPSKFENYPDCIRKISGIAKYNDTHGLQLWKSASFTSDNSAWAINESINGIRYFFYPSGVYQTVDKKRKGWYSCSNDKNNTILIDGIDPVYNIGTYEAYIKSNRSIDSVFRGSKNSSTIPSKNQIIDFNIPYGLIAIINGGKYIGLNKFKTLIPPVYLREGKISAQFVDINTLDPVPNTEEIQSALNKQPGGSLSLIPGGVTYTYTPLVDKLVDNLYEKSFGGNTIKYKSKYNGEEYFINFSLGDINNIANNGLRTLEKRVIGETRYTLSDLDNYPDIKKALINLIKKILSSGGNNYYTISNYRFNDDSSEKSGVFEFTLRAGIDLNKEIEEKGVFGLEGQKFKKTPAQVQYDFSINIETNDIDIIKGIKFNIDPINYKFLFPLDVVTIENTKASDNQVQISPPEQPTPVIDLEIAQKDQGLKYNSDLEIILRTLQLDSFISISNKGADITNLNTVWEITINDTVKKLFEHGTFSNILGSLLDDNNKPENYTDENYKQGNTETKFKYHAAYGFHAGLLSNKTEVKELNDKKYLVDYKKLMTRYVIPYKLSQDLFVGSNVNYPVYIPFGFFIMILNHSCLLYDIKDTKSKKQYPLIYIDFNPNSNICLSNESMLSTNPYRFMIPFEGTLASYKNIFPKNAQPTNPFNIDSKDTISAVIQKLSPFRFEDGNGTNQNISKYRGKFMNVLVNIDYLLNIIASHSTKDQNNGVYLKALLEEIISDMNKYLGNFNIFRLVYNDQADCFYISDDQLVPADSMVSKNPTTNTQKINLYGKKSIALSLDLKTEVSSKLANMLAVSANADTGDQSSAATDASSFGVYNMSYQDRYKPIVKANLDTNSNIVDIGMQITASNNFNSAIESFYSSANASEDKVSSATNYYIERMSKIKNEDTSTRASVMIPLSLNFSTDGISGLNMGQGFTVDNELLPSRYTNNTTFLGEKDYLHKVGFIIVGLDHSIESNRWVSSVRANMFYLKDKSEYTGSIQGSKSNAVMFSISDDAPDINAGIPDNIIINNYPIVNSNYKNVQFGKYGSSNPAGDQINPKLLSDISKAATTAGVVVTITTAISGHNQYTKSGNISRHGSGNAIDISIINEQPVRPKIKEIVEKFTNELITLGYVKNSESGNDKAFLTFGFKNHDNHIHISNRT